MPLSEKTRKRSQEVMNKFIDNQEMQKLIAEGGDDVDGVSGTVYGLLLPVFAFAFARGMPIAFVLELVYGALRRTEMFVETVASTQPASEEAQRIVDEALARAQEG